MSDFFKKLVRPLKLDSAGIDEAVLQSYDRLLMHGMSRFDFSDVAYQVADLRSLPLAHLIDHRVRGPLVPPLPAAAGCVIPAEDWERSGDGLEQWFGHMLEASDRPGARQLVASALGLDPRDDAILLGSLGRLDRPFYRACVRGRLGTAIKHATGCGMAADRTAALALVARLLIYFGCFSVQLVAARAWWIDHLPFRQREGPGPYREAALLGDLVDLASSINEIGAYMAGKRARYPSRQLVSGRKPLAAEWRTGLGTADEEMLELLNAFFKEVRPHVEHVRRSVARAKAIADVHNRTVHKLVYGVSSVEALSFAVDRLVQLRHHSDDLVRRRADGEAWVPLPVDASDLPPVNDPDAATLLFVLRVVTLNDRTADTGAAAGERDVSAVDDRNLMEVLGGLLAGGDPPGIAVRKGTRKLLRGAAPSLARTRGGTFALRRHYDVCPGFWLQTERVEPLPSILDEGGSDLLDAKRRLDELNRNRRPPNVRLASGRKPPRTKRRRPHGR